MEQLYYSQLFKNKISLSLSLSLSLSVFNSLSSHLFCHQDHSDFLRTANSDIVSTSVLLLYLLVQVTAVTVSLLYAGRFY